MMPEDIAYAGVEELGKAYRRGTLSPVEVVETHLERISRLDGRLRAYITVTVEDAIRQAKQAEMELRRGKDRGPLHGIPFAVKDQLLTKGIRTTAGSLLLSNWIPDVDATPVSRLKNAGALLLGKLNMTEFGLGNPSQYPFGRPRNPWNTHHETGGSSGGSGSAPAAGMATVALGADTVGSVRVPAAYCGVVGLRPTWDLVSRYGTIPVAGPVDTIGPLARTVVDVSYALRAMTGDGFQDATAPRAAVPDYRAELEKDVRGIRAAIVRELFPRPGADPEVEYAVAQAIRVLESLGVSTQDVSIPLVNRAGAIYSAFGDSEAAVTHLPNLRRRAHDYGQVARVRLATGLLVPSFAARWADRAGRAAVKKQVLEAFTSCDILVTPTLPTAAPRIEEHALGYKSKADALNGFDLNRPYIVPFALAGVPALSLCCGFTKAGMPLSVQFAGKPYRDDLVLRIAHAYQCATEWHTRRPALG